MNVMTPAAAASFPPVARKENLARLAALPPGPAFPPELWTKVHDEVQAQFALLETEVRRKVAGIRVVAGRTKGGSFYLFSYRTFSIPQSDVDPVVVGLTFTPARQGVTVEADVSGEQTGDMISSVPSSTVANSGEELLAAARESARDLCQSAESITAALQDPSRRVE
jgi:hypothetical protein